MAMSGVNGPRGGLYFRIATHASGARFIDWKDDWTEWGYFRLLMVHVVVFWSSEGVYIIEPRQNVSCSDI